MFVVNIVEMIVRVIFLLVMCMVLNRFVVILVLVIGIVDIVRLFISFQGSVVFVL